VLPDFKQDEAFHVTLATALLELKDNHNESLFGDAFDVDKDLEQYLLDVEDNKPKKQHHHHHHRHDHQPAA